MLLDDKPYTLDRIARITITIIILVAMVWLLHYLRDVLIPFAVALLLAYLINPLVQLIQRKISNRAVAVILSLASIIAVVVLVLWFMIPRITEEMNRLVNIVTNIVEIGQLEDEVEDHLPDEIWEPIKEFIQSDEVQKFFTPENRQKIVKNALSKVLPGVWGIMAGTIALILEIVGLVVILLYLFFLLLDYEKVKRWQDLVPPSYRDRVSAFVRDFESAMSQYFRGQALVAFISGILFAVGFVIVGLPLAVMLGLFFGLLNMVPYLQVLGFIPAFLLAAVHCAETGQNFWTVIGFTALVVVVVQVIQDILLVPRIMGKALGLSPAMILLSLSIWGKLLGMLGLIIALPMTFLLLAYYRKFLATRAVQDVTPS
jgi:predicted PurR-regulated permease PerM